jgi:hypothetical protein
MKQLKKHSESILKRDEIIELCNHLNQTTCKRG